MTDAPSPLIFISYSRVDSKAQQRLADALRKHGLTVWVDNEKLTPGNPAWEREIEKAILSCSAVIAILSPEAKRSEWVRREISFAEQHNKRIFPVLLRGDESSTMTLRMINHQFVDLRQNEKEGVEVLFNTISEYLEYVKANPSGEGAGSNSLFSKPKAWIFAVLGIFALLMTTSFLLKMGPFTVPATPTATTPPTATATIPPTATAQPEVVIPEFFTVDFDTDLENWDTFLVGDPENEVKTSVEKSYMKFELSGKNQHYYTYYTLRTYNNVRVDIRSENRGEYNSVATVICRYHIDKDWYEFNFDSGGLYQILYVKWNDDKTKTISTLIANGGSSLINAGKNVNDYSVICNDRTLSLWINGNEISTVIDNRFVLEEGYVGIGVSSGTLIPIENRIDTLTISQP
ncbi:MAG TPA: toll/interleukin-1 receptor domain-containing protein [Anaerolineales bacterium]|nr:toll/interleukin-1 receptor domain-containing protein [Anaerolineales bacterium]HMV95784.1 toll/interleukin-1 receptor domain-containing protein [Anaerolineales bacterium]HMX19737.1 toll/interleukin-1 receptor domain-containing protein [Anaerolineales bacterium]HMX74710.1 toll/interleukin-1 receptor domain-containing protein [Anaerolineales bacterium]HMZ43565.1 toll/interleukin-1 receptor domain-containing protein [Anaerolineales bacterium]